MMSPGRGWLMAVILLFAAGARAAGTPEAGAFAPIHAENLDIAAFGEWVGGTEHIVAPRDGRDEDRRPQWIIWTDHGTPGHSGTSFGASMTPGQRYLRVGFKSAIPVGAVLLRGGVRVSVLKPDAAYPGNLADESQWISAERIKEGKISTEEAGRDNYVLWTLPRVISTRAIRFSHIADPADREYAGWIGGASILPLRVANVAPEALAMTSAEQKTAPRINNELSDNFWESWSNLPREKGDRAAVVSAANPEWVMLAWPTAVKLRGLGTGFAGFSEAEAQIYTGPADVHPREAPESAWKTIRNFTGLRNGYPVILSADWLDFGQEVTTTAVRVRMIAPQPESGHEHMKGYPRGGKRVWLGELLALTQLPDDADLKSAIVIDQKAKEAPPIAVKFTVPESGWVTLVIEDSTGKRVRNLISETYFEKGEHTVGWDGSDDLARDPESARHGIYYIPTQLVAPGTYRVRGLWRKQIDLKYEFGVYNAGTTPWETADRTGGWLANHSPPSAALFVPNAPDGSTGKTRPAVMLGSYVSEGTAGLAWVDLDGKKWRGQGWVGGNWTGAPYLARDAGPKAVPTIYAYAAAAWTISEDNSKMARGEIRVTGLTAGSDKNIVKFEFAPSASGDERPSWERQIGGMAAYNSVVVVSMTGTNQLLFVDAVAGKALGQVPVESPRGVAFDPTGRLLVLSGRKLVRYASATDPAKLPAAEVLVDGLEDPTGLTLDASGNIYVADRGHSHQVKVFSPAGKLLRSIGKAGEPAAGPYDALRMNNPRGLAIDPQGRLWVAEEDLQPRRVSVWNTDGSLAKAFYGPMEYGGGGALDPKDKTKLYYYGMEFKLDWEKGTDQLASVFYRPGPNDLKMAENDGKPQAAIYRDRRRYWTNAFDSNPTGGNGSAFIFADRNGLAVPAAAAGRAHEWALLLTPPFLSLWPADTDAKPRPHDDHQAYFIWSDLNGDGQVQPNEVVIRKGRCGSVDVGGDLAFVFSRLDGKSVRFAPASFTAANVPVYKVDEPQVLVDHAQNPASSGGDEAMLASDGWSIHTTAPAPFSPHGIGGAKNGVPLWSYPSLWPGLHASHEAPPPQYPGEVVGHTRLLGNLITPVAGESMFLLNGNTGSVYVFTEDGLFVATLMKDMRLGRSWLMPTAQRGMLLNDITPHDENFWPTVTQTADGVYMMAGGPGGMMKVEGLETVRRLTAADVAVTAADLTRATDYFVRAEAARQASQGRGVLTALIRKQAPVVDGDLSDWSRADWAEIDRRGTAAYFNSNMEPYNVTGAVAIAGDRLYAAWRTGDKELLKNAGDVPNAPFKTGGALDLMIGTNAAADPKRNHPVAGDVRLLITQVGGKTRALLYRPVVAAGEARQPVPFASPWRTINFDRVEEVSDQVQLGASGKGDYEVAISLATLGLKVLPGDQIRGDIGILRGNGAATTQRIYWSNKATAILADVPSEAELTPSLWGKWEFKAE